jgi:hypothetical protein
MTLRRNQPHVPPGSLLQLAGAFKRVLSHLIQAQGRMVGHKQFPEAAEFCICSCLCRMWTTFRTVRPVRELELELELGLSLSDCGDVGLLDTPQNEDPTHLHLQGS